MAHNYNFIEGTNQFCLETNQNFIKNLAKPTQPALIRDQRESCYRKLQNCTQEHFPKNAILRSVIHYLATEGKYVYVPCM